MGCQNSTPNIAHVSPIDNKNLSNRIAPVQLNAGKEGRDANRPTSRGFERLVNQRSFEKQNSKEKDALEQDQLFKMSLPLPPVAQPRPNINNSTPLSTLPKILTPKAIKFQPPHHPRVARHASKTPELLLRASKDPKEGINPVPIRSYSRGPKSNLPPETVVGDFDIEFSDSEEPSRNHKSNDNLNIELVKKADSTMPTAQQLSLVNTMKMSPQPPLCTSKDESPVEAIDKEEQPEEQAEGEEEEGEMKVIMFKINRRRVKLVLKNLALQQTQKPPRPPSVMQPKSVMDFKSFDHLSGSSGMTGGLVKQGSFIEQSVKHSQASHCYNAEGKLKVNQYEMLERIGKGAFGEVFSAKNSIDKKHYAIKVIREKKLKLSLALNNPGEEAQCILGEIATYKKLLYEVIEDEESGVVYLVMELVKKGAVLSKRYWRYENFTSGQAGHGTYLSAQKAKHYFRQLVQAVHYLHITVEMVHRDIKPPNILISDTDVLKLADFGISELVGEAGTTNQKGGTHLFLPPEILTQPTVDAKGIDIWSMGITLFFFVHGKLPYEKLDLTRVIDARDLQFRADIPEGLKKLILKCLVRNPKERANIGQLAVDPWLTDNGADPLTVQSNEPININRDDLQSVLVLRQN